jgi:hypothetical protein
MAVWALSGKIDPKEGLEHAESRCLERYGVPLTPALRALILFEAKNCPVKRTYRPACGRFVCTVTTAGHTFRVVTDAAMETIITFLPRKKKKRNR